MENTGVTELTRHTRSEIANQYASQKIIKSWIDHPQTPSSQVIPILHRELMQDIGDYQKKGLIPLEPGAYRMTNVTTADRPDNFFVAGTDVSPVMQQYTRDLDALLQQESSSPKERLQETVQDAAWAYYTFIRIHPYLDGSGRMGRMILKRIIRGRGYKDIIFQTEEPGQRTNHLDALHAVDHSGNLAHLELYLLGQLLTRYTGDQAMQRDLTELMVKKKIDIESQKGKRDLTEVWSGFKGLHLDGVAAQDSSTISYTKAT